MARIPESEIERLKREVSVQRLAEARGVQLKRHGADFIGLCPFHDDHSPSLVISRRKNLWNCLGACRAGGSVIDWVMRAEGVSFRHACELLREDRLPIAAHPNGKPPRISTVPKLPAPVSREADDRALLLQVASYYHETLKQTPEALKYLEARGLKSSEMIDHFQMGFANRTLGYRLPEKNRVAGADLRGRLQKLGIYRESGHEHFNGSVVIPIFNPQGEVVEMYGRKITPGLREGTPLHLYLPGPHRGVWNEEALAVSKEIILCEALIDALTFWCAGYRHVTASYGINGFTDDHRAAIKKYGTRKIYIAYDRDDAGEKAAQELSEELLAMGIECYRVQFPKGMDANEYALKVQPPAKSLGVLLNKAEWMGKGRRPVGTVSASVSISESAAGEEKPQEAEGEKIEAATKEETESAAKEKISGPVLPLAAGAEEPPTVAPAAELAPLGSAAVPPLEIPTEIKGDEIVITQGDRRYRVRGLAKNLSYELLKINLLVSGSGRQGESGFHMDTLGTTTMDANASGTVVGDLSLYPWGQFWLGSSPEWHYAGFEYGDSGTGFYPTANRQYSPTPSRFMSPDPLGGDLTNPQSLNRYAYVMNNPLRYTDPTGMYVCKDSAKCDSDADKAFEKARQADLKSKDANVVRGASAYGDPTKDNGVNVAFGDPGKGNDGITSHGLGVGPDGKLRAEENVTIREGLSGSNLDAVVGHEGSHVADAQDFVSTMTMQGNFDVSKNLSKYQTEFKAYMVSNSIMNSQGDKASYGQGCDGGPCVLGFGVGQRQAGNTINQLLANPANGYGVTPKAPGALLYPTLTVPTVPK